MRETSLFWIVQSLCVQNTFKMMLAGFFLMCKLLYLNVLARFFLMWASPNLAMNASQEDWRISSHWCVWALLGQRMFSHTLYAGSGAIIFS